ncbi:hypothetical protein ABIE26_001731 [Pedobacter africanus]|uniref:Uncharacterized protein n=1 Tax=Pedobacter africanus TaxID=151894 RepID=A0ACC6KRF9_9SPHI|nr:hypothetical protein [Pedobacter africanus]MDR6781781.1 hypothetical protein [Pedobacter africanus]
MKTNVQKTEETLKKYRIEECIDNLKRKEYKVILKSIPGIIGKGMTTFYNYRDLRITDREDIPYKIARKLEILFGLEAGELENVKTVGKHYTQILEEHRNQMLPLQNDSNRTIQRSPDYKKNRRRPRIN